MTMPQDTLLETVLALPSSDRADLAFQLLQSLGRPGDEVSSDEFAGDLRARVVGYRRGTVPGFDLEEVRAIVRRRIDEGRDS